MVWTKKLLENAWGTQSSDKSKPYYLKKKSNYLRKTVGFRFIFEKNI